MSLIGELRRDAREHAVRDGISPRDVDLLLADAIAKDVVYLIAHDDEELDPDAEERFRASFWRRLSGEPLQYIRGRCEFYAREFLVDPRVLIPRPETEVLVEFALSLAKPGARVIDVGTGSGAIGTTIALERPDLEVFATDYSLVAVIAARENAMRLGAKVKFAQADLLQPVHTLFDVIVSNPPYIPDEYVPGLQREVQGHEPHVALKGGPGGLVLIRRLVGEARELLEPGGTLIFEIGWDQGGRIERLGEEIGWPAEVRPDLAGMPRYGVFRKP